MLFVLIMESLNNCLSWVEAWSSGGFLAPISVIVGYRVSLYADDLLFVHFRLASGLFSNLDKSIATP